MSQPTVQWRREPSFWDELEVPTEQIGPHLFTWLEANAPAPAEHDYILSTDGSGCDKGWGASASIIEKVDLVSPATTVTDPDPPYHLPCRGVVERRVLVQATYGSTVQRRELTAFLDGVHEILRWRAEDILDRGREENIHDNQDNILMSITGSQRVSILWYTDRANLASSLLFDEAGVVLNSRKTERDLWMRFSAMAKHVCITPMWVHRNKIPNQKTADALCSYAREALKDIAPQLESITNHIYPTESWKTHKSQKALF